MLICWKMSKNSHLFNTMQKATGMWMYEWVSVVHWREGISNVKMWQISVGLFKFLKWIQTFVSHLPELIHLNSFSKKKENNLVLTCAKFKDHRVRVFWWRRGLLRLWWCSVRFSWESVDVTRTESGQPSSVLLWVDINHLQAALSFPPPKHRTGTGPCPRAVPSVSSPCPAVVRSSSR